MGGSGGEDDGRPRGRGGSTVGGEGEVDGGRVVKGRAGESIESSEEEEEEEAPAEEDDEDEDEEKEEPSREGG